MLIGILCLSCRKEITTTAWNPSEKQLKKWQKPWLKEQKLRAKKDPNLTFITKDFMVGTNLVSNNEFVEFLNSFESIFGFDSLLQLGFDSIQIGSIKNPSHKDAILLNINLVQVGAFLHWKTKKAKFEILQREGIIKLTEPYSVGADNYPPIFFENYLKESHQPVVNDEDLGCCGCGEFRKIRVDDGLPMPKYELMDSLHYQLANSVLKKSIIQSTCELLINDSSRIRNCGFRYKVIYNFRPSYWE